MYPFRLGVNLYFSHQSDYGLSVSHMNTPFTCQGNGLLVLLLDLATEQENCACRIYPTLCQSHCDITSLVKQDAVSGNDLPLKPAQSFQRGVTK